MSVPGRQSDRGEIVSILIADDHGVLRAGLHKLLEAEPGMHVVGEATDGEEAVHQAAELQPDVVLLDVSMPGPGGVEVTRQIKEILPEARVLILTAHEDEGLLRGAVEAGAAGYVTKRAIEPELITAIQAVWRGDMYVHPAMTRALLKAEPSSAREETIGPLTPREIDVLCLIAQGYTNGQAAEELGIGVRTVETHRANLMGKLGLRGRVELVRYAREHGLLD